MKILFKIFFFSGQCYYFILSSKIGGLFSTYIAWSAPFLKTFENMRKLDFFQAPSTKLCWHGCWCWQPEKNLTFSHSQRFYPATQLCKLLESALELLGKFSSVFHIAGQQCVPIKLMLNLTEFDIFLQRGSLIVVQLLR